MGLEKVGATVGKEIIAWTRTSGSKSLLTAKSVKIDTCGLRYAPKLQGDMVQISKKAKSADTYFKMIEHFSMKHPNNKQLLTNLAKKGVEAHPDDLGLVIYKSTILEDNLVYINDLSRLISLKPTCQSYFQRAEAYFEQGNTQKALEDLKKALELAKKEKLNPEYIAEIKKLIGSNDSNWYGIEPLPLTQEQKLFNAKIDEYCSKYQKEINEVFDKKDYFMMSNANTTLIEISAKNHLLNSIKKIGKAEDFGLQKNQTLYHGTSSNACASIGVHGFDLSKCERMETGKGAYFGLDEQAVRNAYGSNIIRARFTGENIALVEPGVYDVIAGSPYTSLKRSLADKLGLDICKDEKIIGEIVSRYYNKLLEGKGIEGIITKASFNAGMPYFMVPNPSKYIEIL